MATKFNGPIRLSRIPKELIVKNKAGESVIYVDFVPRKGGADQYGNTHSLSVYNKATRETIYLGDFKPVEFGTQQPAPAPANNYRQAAPAPAPTAAAPANTGFDGQDIPF